MNEERFNRLTPRGREIYRLRTEGYSKRMIANELHITFHQVEEHLAEMRTKLGNDPFLPRTGLAPFADPERLNRLTPRERDVYEVWREHPDWTNAQISYEVMYLPPHVVRRYKENIKRKLEDPDPPQEEP